ncbi:uncharacterized protein L201_000185 [Kwoniella dendrophila CBS 6074]|uniref:Uncharacterized protein n=1 Tax=Kwoniella dendrophila CBS 6074 TaxID=1295534 RepID=A0AAX4JK78_9TREE
MGHIFSTVRWESPTGGKFRIYSRFYDVYGLGHWRPVEVQERIQGHSAFEKVGDCLILVELKPNGTHEIEFRKEKPWSSKQIKFLDCSLDGLSAPYHWWGLVIIRPHLRIAKEAADKIALASSKIKSSAEPSTPSVVVSLPSTAATSIRKPPTPTSVVSVPPSVASVRKPTAPASLVSSPSTVASVRKPPTIAPVSKPSSAIPTIPKIVVEQPPKSKEAPPSESTPAVKESKEGGKKKVTIVEEKKDKDGTEPAKKDFSAKKDETPQKGDKKGEQNDGGKDKEKKDTSAEKKAESGNGGKGEGEGSKSVDGGNGQPNPQGKKGKKNVNKE